MWHAREIKKKVTMDGISRNMKHEILTLELEDRSGEITQNEIQNKGDRKVWKMSKRHD